jgi:hypothetical protein
LLLPATVAVGSAVLCDLFLFIIWFGLTARVLAEERLDVAVERFDLLGQEVVANLLADERQELADRIVD